MARSDRDGLTRGEQKQRTREALVRAGVDEFSRRGLDAPSLDDICARAGFTRGAFYVHFPDRDAFLVAVMEHLLGVFLQAIVTTADPAHDLARTVARFADLAATAPDTVRPLRPRHDIIPFHQLLDGCRRLPAIRERFLMLVTEAIARLGDAARAGQAGHTVRADIDPDATGKALVVMALGVLAALEAGLPMHASELASAVVGLLSPGAPGPRPSAKPSRRSRTL